jgi:hypothetical protein
MSFLIKDLFLKSQQDSFRILLRFYFYSLCTRVYSLNILWIFLSSVLDAFVIIRLIRNLPKILYGIPLEIKSGNVALC